MADSKAQKIVSVIIAAVQSINTGDGFETDIGTQPVEDWKVDFDEDELPSTSVCDLTEEVAEDEKLQIEGFHYMRLPVQIRAFVKSDARAADGRKIKADILKALNPLKNGFRTETETLVDRVDLRRAGFVLADDAFSIAAVAVEIDVFYLVQEFNAYE